MSNHKYTAAILLTLLFVLVACDGLAQEAPRRPGTDYALSGAEPGVFGGRLTVTLRAEPKTINPVFAVDVSSKDVIWRMMADLVHINRSTQHTEAALAKSWKVSPDGLRYTLQLRKGLHFSDGHPLDADDVLFSFQVYLDENLHAPQRDLLLLNGKPIRVNELSPETVVFELPEPYGAGERLFDNFAILPKHLLEKPYKDGKLEGAWSLNTPAAQIAGAGPFRLKEYQAGQRLVLERNPYYWKADSKGRVLPYLDEIVFLFVGNEDAQVIRFQAGETDVINRLSASNFNALSSLQDARGFVLADVGPSLEVNFLFFNLNDLSGKALPKVAKKQEWFQKSAFRKAVSAAIDRESIVQLVYRGRGVPLESSLTPGNKIWGPAKMTVPLKSVDRARALLRDAGFHWNDDGKLMDANGVSVEFTIAVSSSSAERTRMATLIQDDLKQIGIRVQVVPLEFRALLSRVLDTKDYEACILGLADNDADPNSEMSVWLSSAPQHLWNPNQAKPATPWEAEIDRLMKAQLTARKPGERKTLYQRVLELSSENQPLIFLASPHILVGAKKSLGNFHPASLEHYTLWNADELFWAAK